MVAKLSFFNTLDDPVFEIKLKRSEFDRFLQYFTPSEIYNGNLDIDPDDHDGDILTTSCDDLWLVRKCLFTCLDIGLMKSDLQNSAWNVETVHLDHSSVSFWCDL